MKKVRFESPNRGYLAGMDGPECHSPRPFMETQAQNHAPDLYLYQRVLPYSNDPLQRYECSDSSPYPTANKTQLPSSDPRCRLITNDLELSMLDASSLEPRNPIFKPATFQPIEINRIPESVRQTNPKVLTSIENKTVTPPNVLSKDNSFFIRRDNLDKYRLELNPLHNQFNRLGMNKENNPMAKKAELMKIGVLSPVSANLAEKVDAQFAVTPGTTGKIDYDCQCHHCVKVIHNNMARNLPNLMHPFQNPCLNLDGASSCNKYQCVPPQDRRYFHCDRNLQNYHRTCHCANTGSSSPPQNSVDKKTWAIQKYEQNKKSECKDLEKQTNIAKEKREPTVSDLFKIIKLQNEQLQLLQDKVDKFISASNKSSQNVQTIPLQNYMTEHVALQTIDSDQHKISIGVMTSFEMVRTSTVINKEIVTQTNENAQIQCNRSQISIKEVVSKSQPVNLNFLDGIMPTGKRAQVEKEKNNHQDNVGTKDTQYQYFQNINEEKTFNELSLCNIQVDNATTPLLSPEQSLYLDVRDYSDSESGSDDQSNVGWTYYNKVMTHVNGMLQDSDMPSSASALYRNTRQQCVQMQIDKTNLSVTKRVKFGDDPLGVHQPHIYAPTDTSMKMHQLAAKYLKAAPPSLSQQPATKPDANDLSFATRNYMERHKLLQGIPVKSRSPTAAEMPRFLDITALKRQPKLL